MKEKWIDKKTYQNLLCWIYWANRIQWNKERAHEKWSRIKTKETICSESSLRRTLERARYLNFWRFNQKQITISTAMFKFLFYSGSFIWNTDNGMNIFQSWCMKCTFRCMIRCFCMCVFMFIFTYENTDYNLKSIFEHNAYTHTNICALFLLKKVCVCVGIVVCTCACRLFRTNGIYVQMCMYC